MLGSGWVLARLSPRQPRGPEGGAVGQIISMLPLPSTGPKRKGGAEPGKGGNRGRKGLLALLESPGARGSRAALPGASADR